MVFIDYINSIDADTFNITTKPKPLASAKVISRQRVGRVGFKLTNTGTEDIYIGGADVTVAKGMPVKAGESIAVAVSDGAENNINVIAASATAVNLAEFFL